MSIYAKGDPNDAFLQDEEGSALRAVREIMTEAPVRGTLIIVLLLLASIAEGLGILAVLPLLGPFIDGGTSSVPALGLFEDAFATVAVEPSTAVILGLIVLFISTKAVLVFFAMSLVGFASTQYVTDLRMSLLGRLMSAKWSFFLNQPVGVFANALGVEATVSGSTYTQAFKMIALSLQVFVYLGASLFVSWQATIAAVIGGLLIGVLLSRLIRISKNAGLHQRLAYENLSGRLSDAIQGIKPLKAMAIEKRVLPLLHSEVDELRRTEQVTVLSQEGLRSGQEVIAAVLLAIGFLLALSVDLEFDTLLVMAVLFFRATGRIGEVQRSYQQLVRSEPFRAGVKRKIEAAEDASEGTFGKGEPSFKTAISVGDVQFSYGSGSVLNGVNLTINKGTLTTIRGPSGSGKTTLIDLIIGLYRPVGGSIKIDGKDLSNLNIAAWRSSLGYVPQDPFLFHDSIYRNVTLNDTNISKDEVMEALRLAGASEFIEQLPEGLDTVPGERGAKLSGGQRQRVALARALVRKPSLLILDEPTTALDPRTEDEICATLSSLKGTITLLVITHQPALGRIADIVYELGEGRVILASDAGPEAVE